MSPEEGRALLELFSVATTVFDVTTERGASSAREDAMGTPERTVTGDGSGTALPPFDPTIERTGGGDNVARCRWCGDEIVQTTDPDLTETWTWMHVHPTMANPTFCGDGDVAEPDA